jgi:K+-transporting ATPase KdpF subunit
MSPILVIAAALAAALFLYLFVALFDAERFS